MTLTRLMSQVKNSKAASFMMAAFLMSGCQPKTESFFEASGGEPVMFQHFFWFIGHPEIFLPLLLIASIGVILVLRRVSKRFAARVNQPFPPKLSIPALWIYGLIVMTIMGALSSFLLFQSAIDSHLHDTYYVVAHLQYLFTIGLGFAIFWILYLGFEGIFRCAYNQKLAKIQFALFFIGILLMSFPQIFLSLRPMPRRYIDYEDAFEIWKLISMIGAIIALIGAASFILVVIEALVKKRPIGDRTRK